MGNTTLIIHSLAVRITPQARREFIRTGLTYAVVIAKDVSVRVVGSIESVHRMSSNAQRDAARLCKTYECPDCFVVVDLDHIG